MSHRSMHVNRASSTGSSWAPPSRLALLLFVCQLRIQKSRSPQTTEVVSIVRSSGRMREVVMQWCVCVCVLLHLLWTFIDYSCTAYTPPDVHLRVRLLTCVSAVYSVCNQSIYDTTGDATVDFFRHSCVPFQRFACKQHADVTLIYDSIFYTSHPRFILAARKLGRFQHLLQLCVTPNTRMCRLWK